MLSKKFEARDNDKSKDNSVLETIAFIEMCFPNLILQRNAGYKSDIPDELLKTLGLWKFEKSHHQDAERLQDLAYFGRCETMLKKSFKILERWCLNIEITLRKWQEEAVKRSIKNPAHGIFLEALGGRGKTICALSICKAKSADKVIIVNNRVAILDGWKETVKKFGFDKEFEVVYLTDRALQNVLKRKK